MYPTLVSVPSQLSQSLESNLTSRTQNSQEEEHLVKQDPKGQKHSIKKQRSKRDKYMKLDENARKELIRHVFDLGKSVKDSAKLLGLKHSSAKVIVKRYKEEGILFRWQSQSQQRPKIDNRTVTQVKKEIDQCKWKQSSQTDQKTDEQNINKEMNIHQQFLTTPSFVNPYYNLYNQPLYYSQPQMYPQPINPMNFFGPQMKFWGYY